MAHSQKVYPWRCPDCSPWWLGGGHWQFGRRQSTIKWSFLKDNDTRPWSLMGFLFLCPAGWQNRGDSHLHQPSLFKTLHSGLLLRGGAAPAVWGPWHQQHSQWAEGGRLPGRHGVHAWPGGSMTPFLPFSLLRAFLLPFFPSPLIQSLLSFSCWFYLIWDILYLLFFLC